MNAKENYLAMLRGEIPEFMPSMYDDRMFRWEEELLTPVSCPNGPRKTRLGVTYVGCADLNNGAMPAPGMNLLGEDIRGWRDILKAPDLSDIDFETYYTKKLEGCDRSTKMVSVGGGDYFLTLVSFMGFENLFLNMYEEPEEIKAILDFVNEFYMRVLKESVYYLKPDVISIMDDDSAYRSPFFSVETYREFFKPYHKMHCDLAAELGLPVERHDCGRCEDFIPDWVEMGIKSWNPAQISNDLKGIKQKFGNKLTISGGWDMQRWDKCTDMEELRAALMEYVDTFAPGGGFVYSAMTAPNPADPMAAERAKVVRDVYDNYAKDYYKTH